MNNLGLEIISIIVDYLATDHYTDGGRFESRLSQYAPISQAWQHEVSRHCFEELRITRRDLGTFIQYFQTSPRRRLCLRYLRFACFPANFHPEPSERAKELRRFRADVHALLGVLKEWDDDDEQGVSTTKAKIDLILSEDQEGAIDFAIPRPRNVFEPSLAPRQLILSEDPLPISRRVRSLRVECGSHISIHPVSISQIAAALPSLQALEFSYEDPPLSHRNSRLMQRNALVHGLNLLSGKLPCLKKLTITREENHQLTNHNFVCQDFTDERGIDPLCEAIRKLAQPTLESLSLDNFIVSRDLFWDRRVAAAAGTADTWPHLRQLTIDGSVIAPDGTWYTTGDPQSVPSHELVEEDEAMEDAAPDTTDIVDPAHPAYFRENGQDRHHTWRQCPDNSTIGPLLNCFTKAIIDYMPRLEEATLEIGEDYVMFPKGHGFYEGAKSPRLVVKYYKTFGPTVPPERRWVIELRASFREWSIPPSLQSKWEAWVGPKNVLVLKTPSGYYETSSFE